MKTISIRDLHLQTGRWVRQAASRAPIIITDRGRKIAILQPITAAATARPLPNRERALRREPAIPVDSVIYQMDDRADRDVL